MNSPNLITASDERERCCVLDSEENRCPQKARFWVGANGLDDYTHVCGDHVKLVLREGDTVEKLS